MIDRAKEIVGDRPVITYKHFKKYFSNADEKIHFNKTSGFDHLKGKDIDVVGTTHLNHVAYGLYAKVMGIDLVKSDFTMNWMKDSRNGLEFWFYTFLNPDLRELQMSIIEN